MYHLCSEQHCCKVRTDSETLARRLHGPPNADMTISCRLGERAEQCLIERERYPLLPN